MINNNNQVVMCPHCKKKVKPVKIPNKLGMFKYMILPTRISSKKQKKYLLECPNCGYILGSTN